MDALIACHECDVIHRIKPLPGKGAAHCIRCDAVLYKHKPNSLDRTLAFAFAGLILFILANSFPFLGLKIGSQVRETTLITGIYAMNRNLTTPQTAGLISCHSCHLLCERGKPSADRLPIFTGWCQAPRWMTSWAAFTSPSYSACWFSPSAVFKAISRTCARTASAPKVSACRPHQRLLFRAS